MSRQSSRATAASVTTTRVSAWPRTSTHLRDARRWRPPLHQCSRTHALGALFGVTTGAAGVQNGTVTDTPDSSTDQLVVADPLAPDSRIVVGVDDSDHAVAALRWALREAVLRSATVEAVLVWTPPIAALPFGATFTATGDDGEIDAAARVRLDELVNEALAQLDGALADTHPGYSTPDVHRTVMPGAAAMSLIDVAKDADLLVVGSHGRTGLRRLVLGSVAMACVQHAACPVTVVRIPE